MGHKQTKETRQKISKAIKKQWQDPIFRKERIRATMEGLKRACRATKKIRRACPICGNEYYVYLSVLKQNRGIYCSNECANIGRSNTLSGRKLLDLTKKKIREKLLGKKLSDITKNKIREKRKLQRIPTHHTKPELKFEEICKKYNLPYKYVGDGKFWIENINPDFVESNGKKIAIEIFGNYWHSPLLNPKIRESGTLPYREKTLKKYGWKLIVFWEDELKNKNAEKIVMNRTMNFRGK